MARTLLRLTQHILTSLDGDTVSTITGSEEAKSVVEIIEQNFYEIAALNQIPDITVPVSLDETGVTTPTIMLKPSNVSKVSSIYYDISDASAIDRDMAKMHQVTNEEFLKITNEYSYENIDIDVQSYTFGTKTFSFQYKIADVPTIYTIWQDSVYIFDACDLTQFSFLRSDRMQALGVLASSWTASDGFIPFTDPVMENLLFQQSKEQAFLELKQADNKQATRKARKALINVHKKIADNQGMDYYTSSQLPNYGRK